DKWSTLAGAVDGRPMVIHGYLHITLRITSHSETRKLDYRPWSRAMHPDAQPTRVGDEFGNNYKPLLRPGIRINNIPRDDDQSLYPGKDTFDTIICELPIEKAKLIRLTLPATAVGQQGTYRVEFPVGAIQKPK